MVIIIFLKETFALFLIQTNFEEKKGEKNLSKRLCVDLNFNNL